MLFLYNLYRISSLQQSQILAWRICISILIQISLLEGYNYYTHGRQPQPLPIQNEIPTVVLNYHVSNRINGCLIMRTLKCGANYSKEEHEFCLFVLNQEDCCRQQNGYRLLIPSRKYF